MPFNRFIALVKPYINLLAGAITAWLIAKSNVLGIPGLGEHGDELTTAIAGALAWIVTQGATQAGDLKWLQGHQLSLAGDAQVQAAALQAPAAAPHAVAFDPEHEAFVTGGDDLPDDDEEFASPPPDESNVPVQPSQAGLQGVLA